MISATCCLPHTPAHHWSESESESERVNLNLSGTGLCDRTDSLTHSHRGRNHSSPELRSISDIKVARRSVRPLNLQTSTGLECNRSVDTAWPIHSVQCSVCVTVSLCLCFVCLKCACREQQTTKPASSIVLETRPNSPAPPSHLLILHQHHRHHRNGKPQLDCCLLVAAHWQRRAGHGRACRAGGQQERLLEHVLPPTVQSGVSGRH